MDLQWRTKLSAAEENLLALVETATFSCELDSALRTTLRNRKDVPAMLSTQPLSSLVQQIDDALEESEKKDEFLIDVDEEGRIDGEGVGDGGRAPADEDPAVPCEVKIEIKKAIKKSADNQSVLEGFVDACWRKVDTCVVLVHETTSDASAVCDRLQSTEVNKLRMGEQAEQPNDIRFVLMVYDLKAAGESSSHPSTRIAPLRNNGDHLKLCLRGALDARGDSSVGARDMFLLFDGGRAGPHPDPSFRFPSATPSLPPLTHHDVRRALLRSWWRCPLQWRVVRVVCLEPVALPPPLRRRGRLPPSSQLGGHGGLVALPPPVVGGASWVCPEVAVLSEACVAATLRRW